MSSLEDDLLKRLRAFQKARDGLEAASANALAALYEDARKEVLEYFLDHYGNIEDYELQHIERTLQEIDRLLHPYTIRSAQMRLEAIDKGWEAGARFAWGVLHADPAITAPLAKLEIRLGLVDRRMVGALYGDLPKLAGRVTEDVKERIRNQLVIGAVRGESIPKIAKRIAGTGLTQEGLKKPFGTLNKRATLIARTEIIKASDAGYDGLVEQAQEVIQEEIFDLWLTAQDNRVEAECKSIAAGGADGAVPGYPGMYKRGAGPRPVLSTHPGCRCRRVPMMKRWLKEGLVNLPKVQGAA